MIDTLKGLQDAFKKVDKEQDWVDKERKLMNEVVKYTCSLKGTSPVQGYDAAEVLEFLDKPAAEVKQLLHIEDMSEKDLQTLMYSLAPKVKKFGNFMT